MARLDETALMITRDVYLYCSAEIKEWMDVGAMQGQLMKYGIIQTPDDMHGITDGPPSKRRDYLFCKVCQIRNGFALLYQCLRESQDSQMGHRDAADALLERARQVTAAAPSSFHQDSNTTCLNHRVNPTPFLYPPSAASAVCSSTSSTVSIASCLSPGMLSMPVEEQRDGVGGEASPPTLASFPGLPNEATLTQARLSISDLIMAEDFETLYKYSLDKTDFDLEITSLKQEQELLNYITRFTVAIFNSRGRSHVSLPGVLIAGISYSVYPSTYPMATVIGETVTKGEIVMGTMDEDNFEEKLHRRLRKWVGCRGSDRLLSDEELGCINVEFTPVGNHGNSVCTVYVCPTWEICEGNLYFCQDHTQTPYGEEESSKGVRYWVRGDEGCGQLLYHRVGLQALLLLSTWQQHQEKR